MVTQVRIAAELGLDVSTVNKIINRVEGPVFLDKTIKAVFQKARELGYQPSSASKGIMRRTLEELFPREDDNVTLAIIRGVDHHEVVRIKKMVYKDYSPKEGRPLPKA
jgi:DNA-binding LacI/PurR family transcriptional regulator